MVNIIKNIILSNRHKLIKRIYDIKLLKNTELQKSLEINGFVHINNIIHQEQIDELNSIYKVATKKFDFNTNNSNFLNTMSLTNSEVKAFLKNETTPIVKRIFEKVLDLNKFRIPFGAAYCINPPNTNQSCNPHQDPAYVDETVSYSVIAWIPLTDINMQNGCLHILPKSHLWGNNKRSISMGWAFEKYSNEFWKHMIPIPAKSGDIIFFDCALIHGSNVNNTNKDRLAINIPLLPSLQKMITYYPINNNKLSCYEIDEDYYLKEYLFSCPSNKYKIINTVKLPYYHPKDFSRLLQQIKK